MIRLITILITSAAILGGPEGNFGGLSQQDLNVMKAETIFQVARQAKQAKKYDEARDHLKKILALDFPQTAQAQNLLGGTHLLLGQVEYTQGNIHQAKVSADQAVALCRDGVMLSEAYKLLSRIAKDLGDGAGSEAHLKRAMEILEKVGQ